MNYLAILGAVAALLMLSMGLLCLVLSRAPGWRSYRLFSGIAFVLSIYAVNNAITSVPSQTILSGFTTAAVNAAIDLLMIAFWIHFSHQRQGVPLGRFGKWLSVVLFAGAGLMLIPGVAVVEAWQIYLPELGIYNDAIRFSLIGNLIFATGSAACLYILLGFLGVTNKGALGDRWAAFGFFLFLLPGFEDALVVTAHLPWPYLGSLGFAGIIVLFGADLSARVSAETKALQSLNLDLESQVRMGSEELARDRAALLIAERRAALGQLADGVGHGINNPLGSVSGNLCFLRDFGGGMRWSSDESDAIEEALIGVERISQIVGDLTVFSEVAKEDQGVADVERAVLRALRIVSPRYRSDVEFRKMGNGSGCVAMGAGKLTQVLVNLLSNAADASLSLPNALVTIEIRQQGASLILEVVDEGEGIGAQDRKHVFDPLFTTKAIGQGVGLGLFVCRAMVDDAGGTISLDSELGAGTRACISLPLSEEAVVVAVASAPDGQALSIEGISVFLIDDEPLLTRAVVRMLGEADVTIENDSEVAMERLCAGETYDVILCDLMMPVVSGIRLYEKVIETCPGLASSFVFISGGVLNHSARRFVDRGDVEYMRKPLMSAALRATLRRVADAQDSQEAPASPGVS